MVEGCTTREVGILGVLEKLANDLPGLVDRLLLWLGFHKLDSRRLRAPVLRFQVLLAKGVAGAVVRDSGTKRRADRIEATGDSGLGLGDDLGGGEAGGAVVGGKAEELAEGVDDGVHERLPLARWCGGADFLEEAHHRLLVNVSRVVAKPANLVRDALLHVIRHAGTQVFPRALHTEVAPHGMGHFVLGLGDEHLLGVNELEVQMNLASLEEGIHLHRLLTIPQRDSWELRDDHLVRHLLPETLGQGFFGLSLGESLGCGRFGGGGEAGARRWAESVREFDWLTVFVSDNRRR